MAEKAPQLVERAHGDDFLVRNADKEQIFEEKNDLGYHEGVEAQVINQSRAARERCERGPRSVWDEVIQHSEENGIECDRIAGGMKTVKRLACARR